MTNVLPVTNVFNDAEHELSAFLCAVTSVIGFNALSRASDLWIQVMKSSDWPTNENFEKFFRSVTIRAASQLEESAGAAREKEPLDLRATVTATILRGINKFHRTNLRPSIDNDGASLDKERV